MIDGPEPAHDLSAHPNGSAATPATATAGDHKMNEPATVSVKILDKEYQVACRSDEIEALASSARHLDQQMRKIRESGKVFGLDRIAVMAALNLANELLQNRGQLESLQSDANARVRSLTDRLTVALAEHKQLKL